MYRQRCSRKGWSTALSRHSHQARKEPGAVCAAKRGLGRGRPPGRKGHNCRRYGAFGGLGCEDQAARKGV